MKFKHFLVAPWLLLAPLAHAGDADSETAAFVQKAATHALFEQALNTVALTKATNSEIKTYAQQLYDNHRQFSNELNWTLAAAKMDAGLANVRISAYQQQKLSELQVKSGRAFDSAYLDIQAKEYEETIEAYETYADDGEHPTIADLAKKQLTLIEAHQEKLEGVKL